ncbi:MAG: DUF4386 domain-containing protein [Syntrophomonadaceae bacterium]
MTLRNDGRLAGFAFLLYIGVSLAGMFLTRGASQGADAAARLASMAQHAGALRLALLFDLVGSLCALVLAVTLYAITRDVDGDLALLAAVCRIAEGVTGALSLERGASRLWLAAEAGTLDPGASSALGAVLVTLPGHDMPIGATLFSLGSLLFAGLFVRGRIVPAALGWLGVAASVLTVGVVPLQLVGIAHSPLTDFIWLPMLVFEVWLAFFLIVKGPSPAARRAA